MNKGLIMFALLFFVGCGAKDGINWSPNETDHTRATALMAKYNVFGTDLVTPGPSPNPSGPKVGDKCPECNDPPAYKPHGCGPGNVGDGTICFPCGVCKGDGKIDEGDSSGEEYEKVKATQDSFLEYQISAFKMQKLEAESKKEEEKKVEVQLQTPKVEVKVESKPAPVKQTQAVEQPKYKLVMYTMSNGYCPPCESVKANILPVLRNQGVEVPEPIGATSGSVPRFDIYRDGVLVANHTGYLSVESFYSYVNSKPVTTTVKKKVESSDWRSHPWTRQRWTFPGTIENHLREHRVPEYIINSLTRSDRVLLHNYLHNKERNTGSRYYEGEAG